MANHDAETYCFCRALESLGLQALQELGHGAQGLVLLCTNPKNPTIRLACKTILARKDISSASKRRKLSAAEVFVDAQLRWEADVLHQLRDVPGVLPLASTFEGDDTCFHLLTAFCDAGDLLTKLDSRPPLFKLHDSEAAPIVSSLATPLASCHARGIVHRDIKPGNILFRRRDDGSEQPILADFGLAETITPGETLCECVGTSRYQAPEVIKGCYDQRADTWSLGVVIHLLLTSTLPFDLGQLPGDAPSSAIHQAILCNQLKLDAFGISPSAQDLLARILCKDPDARLTLDELLCHPWLLINSSQVMTPAPTTSCNSDFEPSQQHLYGVNFSDVTAQVVNVGPVQQSKKDSGATAEAVRRGNLKGSACVPKKLGHGNIVKQKADEKQERVPKSAEEGFKFGHHRKREPLHNDMTALVCDAPLDLGHGLDNDGDRCLSQRRVLAYVNMQLEQPMMAPEEDCFKRIVKLKMKHLLGLDATRESNLNRTRSKEDKNLAWLPSKSNKGSPDENSRKSLSSIRACRVENTSFAKKLAAKNPLLFLHVTRRVRCERRRDDFGKSYSSKDVFLDGFCAEIEEVLLKKQEIEVNSKEQLDAKTWKRKHHCQR
ncbi:hypothetical protein L7F22_038711 [Adiantum nelumboides]|nr:hypothetical protein [Adiantum nelumboides]